LFGLANTGVIRSPCRVMKLVDLNISIKAKQRRTRDYEEPPAKEAQLELHPPLRHQSLTPGMESAE
jgi:hypothetical protein